MHGVAVNASCSAADASLLLLLLLLVLVHTRTQVPHALRTIVISALFKIRALNSGAYQKAIRSFFQIVSYCFLLFYLHTHSLTHSFRPLLYYYSVFVHELLFMCPCLLVSNSLLLSFSLSLIIALYLRSFLRMQANLPYRARTIFNNSPVGSDFITFLNALFYHFSFVRFMYLSAIAIGTYRSNFSDSNRISDYSFWNKSNIKT